MTRYAKPRYDIIFDPGREVYWIVDQHADEWIAGPYISSEEAEEELSDYNYVELPEDDLEP